MNTLVQHSCESCRGTGKVVCQRTREIRGVKHTREFRVDCPGKLLDAFLRRSPDPSRGSRKEGVERRT